MSAADRRVSWCRILQTGPPCPHLCASWKAADALLTDEERDRLLADRIEAQP